MRCCLGVKSEYRQEIDPESACFAEYRRLLRSKLTVPPEAYFEVKFVSAKVVGACNNFKVP